MEVQFQQWTSNLNKLLRTWKKQIGERERGHTIISQKNSHRHYFYGVPTVIMTSIAGIGVLATFQKCPENSQCKADEWIRLASGIIMMISACLSGVFTFFNFQDRALAHKVAADDYNVMFRHINTMLQVPPEVRGDPVTVLQNIRSQYDDIVRKSPSLPEKYNVDLTYKFNISTDSPSSSDEDVCIDFDLDNMCAHNPTKAAYIAAGLAIEQDILYQKSLQNQLKHELERSTLSK